VTEWSRYRRVKASSISEKGFEIENEHLYKLYDGNHKPDIVATINDATIGRLCAMYKLCPRTILRAGVWKKRAGIGALQGPGNGRCYVRMAYGLGKGASVVYGHLD